MQFKIWLEQNIQNIKIDLSSFIKAINNEVEKITIQTHKRNERLNSYKYDSNIVLKGTINYPGKDNLYNAIKSLDAKRISSENIKFNKWISDNIGKPGFNQDNSRDAWFHIYNLINYLGRKEEGDFEIKYKEEVNKLIQQTEHNMDKLKLKIEQAINNIENWNGSHITLIAKAQSGEGYNNYLLEPGVDTEVSFGDRKFESPSFSLFVHEDKIIIDDVLEGGDVDFFKDPEDQSDYFALINELRNPGHTKLAGKILTLYTARPKSDSQLFQNAKTIPNNIFLTTSIDTAENFGKDYGSNRDVYKIKIDSKYLTNTLDTPGEKHYQITSSKPIPVKSIQLI